MSGAEKKVLEEKRRDLPRTGSVRDRGRFESRARKLKGKEQEKQ
jgi:hypothetical protein